MFRRRNAKRSEMAQYIMKGGNPLVGEVSISGAKNAALGILAASVMADEDVLIENLPDVQDINMMLDAIREIGADASIHTRCESTEKGYVSSRWSPRT